MKTEYKHPEKEYARCHELEKKCCKRYKHLRGFVTINNAQQLLSAMDISNVVRFHRMDGGLSYFAGLKGKNKKGDVCLNSFAYDDKEYGSRVILHELSHMVVCVKNLNGQDEISKHHGGDFLIVLENMFQIANKMYKEQQI